MPLSAVARALDERLPAATSSQLPVLQQLRRNLEKAMRLASDRERSRELERATATLEALREPEAGLSRKQLKLVNGALLAVAEARGLSEAFALNEEKVMMRRVARRHDHGRKGCEEYQL